MFTHTKANAIKLLAVARGWQPIRRGPPIWEFTPFHAEGQLCKTAYQRQISEIDVFTAHETFMHL